MHYFLRIPADRFYFQLIPVLAECRSRRTFAHLRSWASSTIPSASSAMDGRPIFRASMTQLLIPEYFTIQSWRTVVLETLVTSAVDVPPIEVPFPMLAEILGERPSDCRPRFGPLQQAVQGARELVLAGIAYRPEHVGWNNQEDERRLAQWLSDVNNRSWSATNVSADDLAFAREWCGHLQDLYETAVAEDCIVVCQTADAPLECG